ncbi:hypothetical protein niasHT_022912 [Heterodera trifolii]|uniref:carbonic anhydrase n=1 Tax=Heterodera trifolii TaxID=157864 RepID=A0ABD2JYL5_9BILA
MINRGNDIDESAVQRGDERGIVEEEQQPKARRVELQSPINFDLSALKRRALDEFPLCLAQYKKSLPGTYKNTGTTIKFTPNLPKTEWPQMSSQMFNQNFRFVGYHFHWSQGIDGSEHALWGSNMSPNSTWCMRAYATRPKSQFWAFFLRCKMHALKKLVYCGQSVTIGDDHTLSSKLLKLPSNNSQEVSSSSNMDHPATPFLRYQGSLTTHPYTEGVTWTMFTDPLVITEEQISLLRLVRDSDEKPIEKNYRPIQSTNGREMSLVAAVSANSNNPSDAAAIGGMMHMLCFSNFRFWHFCNEALQTATAVALESATAALGANKHCECEHCSEWISARRRSRTDRWTDGRRRKLKTKCQETM